MKRTVLIAAGVLALGTLAYVASQLTAQTATPAAAPAAGQRGTRLAILNLAYVIKNYTKYVNFQNEMKGSLKQYEDKINAKKQQIETLGKEAQRTETSQARREELEKQAVPLQREIEDINKDAKAFIGKKSDEQMVILYREVQDASQRYALSQGIDLVLHYTDAVTQTDYYAPPNVARKMGTPACMPLYAAQGLDISQEVVMTLNRAYQPTPAPSGGGS